MTQPSQASQQAMDEILSELSFQKVLLKSIDASVENREEAEKEVQEEIKSLERQLRDLKRSTKGITASIASTSASQQTRASYLTPSNPPAHQGSGPSFGTPSTASTPNSKMDFPDLTSPTMSLPSRKRTHSTHLDGGLAPMADNKRRNSPSPYMTGPTTPASTSGYEYPLFGDGYFDLTVDDDDFPPLDDAFFSKLAKDEELRIQQRTADAAFAQALQDENWPSISTTPSSSGPTAFDRLHGMGQRQALPPMPAPPRAAATPHQMRPWSPASSMSNGPVKSEYQSMSGDDFGSYTANPNRVKVEPSRIKAEPSSSRAMPGTFIGDDSSDTGDSDIQIIDGTNWSDNGRYSRPSTSSSNPYGLPQFKVKGEGALHKVEQSGQNHALQLAMYGKQPLHSWMNNGSMQGSYQPASGSVYNTPASGLGYFDPVTGMQQQSPAGMMPGAYPGMQAPGPGSGYTMNNLPIYGQSPSPFSGLQGPGTLPLGNVIRNDVDMTDFLGQPMGPYTEAMAAQHDYITNDPRKTNEEIQELLQNIRPDVELPKEDREGTPEGLQYPLYEHQKLALTWLKAMEEGSNKGGILADDMGLGKTISSLALILSRPSTDIQRKTTLIVGPVALVRQWEREIRTKIKPRYSLSTHMIHGPGKKIAWNQVKLFDVVLTTYGTLGAELKRYNKYVEEQKANGDILERDIDQAPMNKLFPLLGPQSKFYRVILDEAQCIKNKLTVAARAACQLKSLTRLCLTGTPMMNNVSELYSLIRFLRIKPYNDQSRFGTAFGMLTKGDSRRGDVANGMKRLQALLRSIMLRRVKTSLIDGKPIITLPPKTEEIQHVVFDEDEQNFYSALESKTKIQFNKYMRAGTVGKNYSNILVLLLRLRQCCCHPHLITDFEEAPPAGVELDKEELIKLANSLSQEVIGRLKAANGVFECPVCYDAVTNPSIVIPCGHDTCSECLTQIADRQHQQGVADGEADGGAIKCPSCRGKIEMNKIIDFSTFKKVHMGAEDDVETASENSDEEDSESDSDSDSTESEAGDVDGNGDLRDFIVPDAYDTDDENEDADGDDEAEQPPERKSKSNTKKREEKRRRKAKKGKQKAETKTKEKKTRGISIATLKKDASRSIDGRRKYMKYLKKHWQPSAKVTKCVELLEKFQEEGQKTIIFSQFVSLLDLLQVPIDQKKWVCERYDGSMKADARNDAINRFTEDPKTKIMLISLKAGNAGLNLVAASRVIILDPFWNPYIEMQAVDRAYRIGQQNPVEVHRILIEKTVEDRIIELQERKKKLVEAALDEGASKNLARLGARELAFLFGVGAL